MTGIRNEKNELIPHRTVPGWRMCIDYWKLNKATRKDHFPLPFIDEMLERLANHSFCYPVIMLLDQCSANQRIRSNMPYLMQARP
jgi:hypothetical protein